MIIPGELIALLTFPGVIIHEAAHMLFCKWGRVAVLDVCFFRFGNPAGYVIHEEPRNFHTAFLISVGPFIVNSLLCILLCFPAFVPVRIFDRADPISYFLLWLGLSIGMHAFPSTQDAKVLWQQAGIASVTRIGDCWAPSTIQQAVYTGHKWARGLDEEPETIIPRELPMIESGRVNVKW